MPTCTIYLARYFEPVIIFLPKSLSLHKKKNVIEFHQVRSSLKLYKYHSLGSNIFMKNQNFSDKSNKRANILPQRLI